LAQYVGLIQKLEVLLFARGWVPVQWIGIALAEEAVVVGILQVFDARWIAPKCSVEVLNRTHVGRTTMDHLLFAVAANLLRHVGEHGEQRNCEHGQGQRERDQHIAALLPMMA